MFQSISDVTPSTDSVLTIRGLHKIYWSGDVQIVALRNLNLDIPYQDFTAIIGTSGAGKSTLMNIIGCLEAPSAGDLWICGKNTRAMSESEKSDLRSKAISFVFQSFNLITVLSVYENIELPLMIRKDVSPSQRKDIVRETIQKVGLEKFAHFKPNKLSGGQRQRVAIARAIVTRPSIVLADEPTANLDSKTAQQILDLLIEINEHYKTTFIFSTHDEKLISRVRRVVRIEDGTIV